MAGVEIETGLVAAMAAIVPVVVPVLPVIVPVSAAATAAPAATATAPSAATTASSATTATAAAATIGSDVAFGLLGTLSAGGGTGIAAGTRTARGTATAEDLDDDGRATASATRGRTRRTLPRGKVGPGRLQLLFDLFFGNRELFQLVVRHFVELAVDASQHRHGSTFLCSVSRDVGNPASHHQNDFTDFIWPMSCRWNFQLSTLRECPRPAKREIRGNLSPDHTASFC